MRKFEIPHQATPAEKWIMFVLQQKHEIKPTAQEVGLTVRRVQQVVAKYKIEIVNE